MPASAPPRRLSHLTWLLARATVVLCIMFMGLASSSVSAAAYTPWWVQNQQDTQLWSGPDSQAVSFGTVAVRSSFLVVAPQQGPRLYVLNPLSGNYAYVDASAVAPGPPPMVPPAKVAPPSEPAGAARKSPPTPAGFKAWWVANWMETELWAGPQPWAVSQGHVPQFRQFLVVEPQNGDRLRVWSPETQLFGYLDASVIGPVGPSVWMEPHPLHITRHLQIPGRSTGNNAYVRNLPVVAVETELRHLPNNTTVPVLDAGTTADGTEWYAVGDGQYVRASEVRLPTPPPSYLKGAWIDADLTKPAMVTAYDGNKVVYSVLAIIGDSANPTLRGSYSILRRVENETMDSATLGVPRDAPGGYYLKDVLYTQYFTPQGAALHYNYWLGTFGYPGSHGCLGLSLEDSRWFWDWASIGTPVVVR